MSLELNAHALIVFMEFCRSNGTPEQFLVSCLSSQPNEKIFRQLRSMATTNQTIVNFTAKELTSKLKRVQMKTDIMYRCSDRVNFPSITRYSNNRKVQYSLPSPDEIIDAVIRAKHSAHDALVGIGIEEQNINMDDSIALIADNLPPEFEFIDMQGYEDDDHDQEEDNIFENIEANLNPSFEHEDSEIEENIDEEYGNTI